MNYDEGETNMEKERHGRLVKEQFEEKCRFDSKNQESPAKKSKLLSSGKGIDYDKDADEKQSSLEQAEENGGRVTIGQAHGNDVDIINDLNADKVAAMKAAELVNRNLTEAGHSNMTTEQKKKLLCGSKKSTPAEEGVKGDVILEHKPDNQGGGGLLQAEKPRELHLDLEKQYTAGLRRRDACTVGLGL